MRTAALDGAHVEYFRGIRNPIGIKVGPAMTPEWLLELLAIARSGARAGPPHADPPLRRERGRARPAAADRGGARHAAAPCCGAATRCTATPRRRRRASRRGASTTSSPSSSRRSTSTRETGLVPRRRPLRADRRGRHRVHRRRARPRRGRPRSAPTTRSVDPRLNYEQALEMAMRIAGLLRGGALNAGS